MRQINFSLIILIFIFAECTNNSTHTNRNIQHKDIVIERFDKDFQDYLHDKGVASKQQLTSKYPILLPAFGKALVDNSNLAQSSFFDSLDKYFSDKTLQRIYSDAERTFDKVDEVEKELSEANEHLWEILPGKQLPRFAMHVSGFKQNVIVTDSIASISIDKYLGEEYPLYKDFFYDYQRVQMKPEYITRDYLKAYIISSLLPEGVHQDLASAMIREGKCLYLVSLLLPDISTETLLGYKTKQIKWCKSNERAVWRTTIARKFLYNSEYLIISKYMDDAPYTSLISPVSTSRIGAWIGLQIVESFVKHNSKISVAEILKMDEHKILVESKYNP